MGLKIRTTRKLRKPSGFQVQTQMASKKRQRRFSYPLPTVKKCQIELKHPYVDLGVVLPMQIVENHSCLKNVASVKRQAKKAVSFSPQTKTWDGIRPGNKDFDELVFNFLERRKTIGDVDILRWTNANPRRIFTLCVLMADLLNRLKTLSKGESVPCLPKGGGKAMKIVLEFRPYLLNLQNVLIEAWKAAREFHMKRANDSNVDCVESAQVSVC